MTHLRKRMLEELQRHNYSEGTNYMVTNYRQISHAAMAHGDSSLFANKE